MDGSSTAEVAHCYRCQGGELARAVAAAERCGRAAHRRTLGQLDGVVSAYFNTTAVDLFYCALGTKERKFA